MHWDVLGEWTDELSGKYMKYWCCAQAKDYGYLLDNDKSVGKVKGSDEMQKQKRR